MDIFEQHFTMLKENQVIFEKYKMIENIEIRVSDIIKMGYSKAGKELLTKEKSEEFLNIRSIHYYNVVIKKLEEYSLPEWYVCLSEGVLLEYAVPIFLRVLYKYPLLCGINREGQVLYEMTRLNQEFWNIHKEWKKYLKKIVEKVIFEYEQGTLIAFVSDEYLHHLKKFLENKENLLLKEK